MFVILWFSALLTWSGSSSCLMTCYSFAGTIYSCSVDALQLLSSSYLCLCLISYCFLSCSGSGWSIQKHQIHPSRYLEFLRLHCLVILSGLVSSWTDSHLRRRPLRFTWDFRLKLTLVVACCSSLFSWDYLHQMELSSRSILGSIPSSPLIFHITLPIYATAFLSQHFRYWHWLQQEGASGLPSGSNPCKPDGVQCLHSWEFPHLCQSSSSSWAKGQQLNNVYPCNTSIARDYHCLFILESIDDPRNRSWIYQID